MQKLTSRTCIGFGLVIIALGAVKTGFDFWVGTKELKPMRSFQELHRLSDAQAILHLAKIGRVDEFLALQAKGVSINTTDDDGETALSMSLRIRDNPITTYCFSHGYDPSTEFRNLSGEPGFTGDVALYWAAKTGRTDVVKKLLHMGVLADGPRQRGRNPLGAAVSFGFPDIVRLLVKGGAQTSGLFRWESEKNERRPESEMLPLVTIPLRTRNLEMLELLLSLKVSPEPVIGISGLEAAIVMDWPEAVAALLDAGADPDEQGFDEKTHDHSVKSEVVRQLLLGARASNHFEKSTGSDSHHTPAAQFVRMLFNPDSAQAARLVETLPVNVLLARDNRGWTMPMYALQAGKPELIAAMLAKGVSADAHTKEGISLGCMAVQANNVMVLESLAAQGANLNLYGPGGSPPLSMAIAQRNPQLVNWLLEHGARTELAGPPGETPLMLALRAKDQPLVQRLLSNGANVQQRDASGWPVVFYAVASDLPELLQLVERAGANLRNEINLAGPLLKHAVADRQLEKSRFLLRLGVVPTPDIFAEAIGHSDLLDLLDDYARLQHTERWVENEYWRQLRSRKREEVMQHLADSKSQNFPGDLTPLQWSVAAGRPDIFRLLLEQGANPNQLGVRERTPVIVALVMADNMGSDGEKADWMKMLYNRGANVDSCRHDSSQGEYSLGQTALMISVQKKLPICVKLILQLKADIGATDASGQTAIDYLEPGSESSGKDSELRELLIVAVNQQLESPVNRSPRKQKISL